MPAQYGMSPSPARAEQLSNFRAFPATGVTTVRRVFSASLNDDQQVTQPINLKTRTSLIDLIDSSYYRLYGGVTVEEDTVILPGSLTLSFPKGYFKPLDTLNAVAYGTYDYTNLGSANPTLVFDANGLGTSAFAQNNAIVSKIFLPAGDDSGSWRVDLTAVVGTYFDTVDKFSISEVCTGDIDNSTAVTQARGSRSFLFLAQDLTTSHLQFTFSVQLTRSIIPQPDNNIDFRIYGFNVWTS